MARRARPTLLIALASPKIRRPDGWVDLGVFRWRVPWAVFFGFFLGGFMLTLGSFRLGAMLTVALSLSLLPTTSHAYTPEEQQACQPDAFRLCGPEIPDVDRVTACMIAKKAELSPECRRFFRAGPDPVAAVPDATSGKPLNIKPAATQKTTKAKATKAKAKKPAKPAAT
jgi:hypothetical protein